MKKIVNRMVQDKGVRRDSAENIVHSSEGKDIAVRMYNNGAAMDQILDELLHDAPSRILENSESKQN